ncbi:hypothetical protein N779_25285 [Vibrio coralliilyticus OCN008]|nr:hypothetical protein N779_25285 [Vibrio coralliilyticus OCN008]
MDQLTVLSVLCWIIWWFAFRYNPQSIESIALIIAGFAFNGLLFLHLWMRFVILPCDAETKKVRGNGFWGNILGTRKEKSPKINVDSGALLDSSKKKQWYFNRPCFLNKVPKNIRSFLIFLRKP